VSILDIKARPTVYFDAASSEHRRYYLEFLQCRSWRRCPIQFYLEHGYGDLSAMIENKLAVHYLGNEFGEYVPERSEQWSVK